MGGPTVPRASNKIGTIPRKLDSKMGRDMGGPTVPRACRSFNLYFLEVRWEALECD